MNATDRSPDTKPEITVVIPMRNEREIAPVLRGPLEELAAIGVRVLVIDDASTDGCGEEIRGEGIEVLRRDHSTGFGSAVKFGLQTCLERGVGGYVAWLPGSMRVDPLVVPTMVRVLEARHDHGTAFARGRRIGRQGSTQRRSWLAGHVLALIGGGPFTQQGGTPTVVPAGALPALLDGPDNVEYEMHALTVLLRADLGFEKIPVAFWERPRGQSHWNKGVLTQVRLLLRLAGRAWRYRRGR